ncbi:hypothetical protein [Flavobacterium sp. 3HN19-14]|uniref:hypothetical protein n=1 Tax=Flavobacterium sp. 3HN19-14 TaxID=3448133 RepID=UPI003EE16F04
MSINILIPAKPHIKKYWEKRFGSDYKISNDLFFGMLIVQILDMKIEKPVPIDKSEYSKIIRVTVPEFYFRTKGHSIGYNKKRFIARLITKLFVEELHAFIDIRTSTGGEKVMDSLRLFLDFYQLTEDDCKVESLYRSYQRHKKQTEIKKNNFHEIKI